MLTLTQDFATLTNFESIDTRYFTELCYVPVLLEFDFFVLNRIALHVNKNGFRAEFKGRTNIANHDDTVAGIVILLTRVINFIIMIGIQQRKSVANIKINLRAIFVSVLLAFVVRILLVS